MRRSYARSTTGISPRLLKYRGDYLFILKNLRTNEDLLLRALGLLGALASEEDILHLCQERQFPTEAQAEVKANCLSDRSELFDRLAYLSPMPAGSKDHTKIKLAQSLIENLSSKITAGLRWQDNAFLNYLRDNLGLTPAELQLLWALYLRQSSRELDFLNMGVSDLADELYVLDTCFGMDSQIVAELLLRDSTLSNAGLFETSGEIVRLPARVMLAIAGHISIQAFQAENFIKDSASAYELNSFDLNSIDVQIILALLRSKGPANILLHGKPGCGKTEAARSLIRAAGLDVLHVPVQATGGRNSRLTRLRYADHFAQSCGIIVDEAELILNSAVRFIAYESDTTPAKAVLNSYLDSSKSKTIWILNDTNNLHDSTLRRFHFKLHFDKLSRKQRSHALDLIIGKHGIDGLITRETANRMLSEEHLSPGLLNQIAYALVKTTGETQETRRDAIIDRLLWSNRPNDTKPADESTIEEAYTLDALNLSIPVESVIQTLKNFLAQPKRPRFGLNLLFHGLPGTGKTGFARYLAQSLHRDLIIKRGSDLLGMYVGSTEQAIAAAFKQAQNYEAILLIDESDTFFGARESARQKYEISHTNEFLNQLENHTTIVICCTNMLNHFDQASIRRFHERVEFKSIPTEKLGSVFLTCFSDILTAIPCPADLDQGLHTLTNITAGDFRNIEKRLRLRGSAVSLADIVAQLESETAARCRSAPIGFR